MDTISTILFLGAAQGILLAIVLLTHRRGNRTANRILSMMLILFSVNIILHTFEYINLSFSLPYHSGIVTILSFLFGPLIYFYVKILTTRKFHFGKKEYIQFLPFAVCLALYLPFYLQSIQSNLSQVIQKLIVAMLTIQTLIYMLVAIKALINHSKHIKESFSSIEEINLNWLRFFISGWVITWIFSILSHTYSGEGETGNYVLILISVFMYMIGYLGLRQPEIFSGVDNTNYDGDTGSKEKYKKSTLTPEKAEKYFQNLQDVMAKDKPFLKNDLTLPGLAKILFISNHHLSQIINEKLNQNFFEYINSRRVEEAKKMLLDSDNKNLTIAAIAFDAGFNSISAFNAAFKKHTKMTPSQFRGNNPKNQ